MIKFATKANLAAKYALVPGLENVFIGPHGVRIAAAKSWNDIAWCGGVLVMDGSGKWIIRAGGDLAAILRRGDEVTVDESTIATYPVLIPNARRLGGVAWTHNSLNGSNGFGVVDPNFYVEERQWLTGDLTVIGVVTRADWGLVVSALPTARTTVPWSPAIELSNPSEYISGTGNNRAVQDVNSSKSMGWLAVNVDLPVKATLAAYEQSVVDSVEGKVEESKVRAAWKKAVESLPEKATTRVGVELSSDGWRPYDGGRAPRVQRWKDRGHASRPTKHDIVTNTIVVGAAWNSPNDVPETEDWHILGTLQYANSAGPDAAVVDAVGRDFLTNFNDFSVAGGRIVVYGGRSVFTLMNLESPRDAVPAVSSAQLVKFVVPYAEADLAAGRARVYQQLFLTESVGSDAESISLERLLLSEAGVATGTEATNYTLAADSESVSGRVQAAMEYMLRLNASHTAAWSGIMSPAGALVANAIDRYRLLLSDQKPGDGPKVSGADRASMKRGSYSVTVVGGTLGVRTARERYFRYEYPDKVDSTNPEDMDIRLNNSQIGTATSYRFFVNGLGTSSDVDASAFPGVIEFHLGGDRRIMHVMADAPAALTVTKAIRVVWASPDGSRTYDATLQPGRYTGLGTSAAKKDDVAFGQPAGVESFNKLMKGRLLFVPSTYPSEFKCVGWTGGDYISPASRRYEDGYKKTVGPAIAVMTAIA